MGKGIQDEVWEEILQRVRKSSICAGHSFMQCRIRYRAHYTNSRLAKIFNTVSPLCEQCHLATANYSHMFWSCSSLTKFWSEIFCTLSKVVRVNVTPNVLAALFGVWSSPLSLSLPKKDLIVVIWLIEEDPHAESLNANLMIHAQRNKAQF